MAEDLEKTPDTSGSKEGFQISPSEEIPQSVGGGTGSIRGKRESIEVTVGQLQEKVYALDEKVKNALESRKWIFIATLTVIGGLLTAIGIIIGSGTIIFGLLKDSQDSYRSLQNTYYQELINLRKEVDQKTIQPIPTLKNQ